MPVDLIGRQGLLYDLEVDLAVGLLLGIADGSVSFHGEEGLELFAFLFLCDFHSFLLPFVDPAEDFLVLLVGGVDLHGCVHYNCL